MSPQSTPVDPVQHQSDSSPPVATFEFWKTPATAPAPRPQLGELTWDALPPERSEPKFDRAALYGLSGEYVKWAEDQTEAHPAGIVAVFLARFGCGIGRGPYVEVSATQHHAQFWPVLVGPTATARKGETSNIADRPFPEDPELKCLSGLSSGEGLIFAAGGGEQNDSKPPTLDLATLLAMQAHRRRVYCVEPEFSSVLAQTERSGNTLSATLRNAYDGKTLQNATKNNAMRVEGAHITVVAHITGDEAHRKLSASEMANGFANRFSWIYVRRTKYLADPPPITAESVYPFTCHLHRLITWAQQINGPIRRTPAAADMWNVVYPSLSSDETGIVAQLTVRGAAQVVRLSLIYALLDGATAIDVPHLTAALALWHYSEATCQWIWGDMTGDAIADRILEALRAEPTHLMTRTAINDLFGGNKASRQIQSALNLLHRELRLVQSGKVKTVGRPAEVWKLL